MPSVKRYKNQLFAVYDTETMKHIHIGEGPYALHLAMEWCLNSESLSCCYHQEIDPNRVGNYVGVWWTDGNRLYRDKSSSTVSGLRECGVQVYYHPIHGEVYLVYNRFFQKALPTPSPLIATTPVPLANERLPHPFQ